MTYPGPIVPHPEGEVRLLLSAFVDMEPDYEALTGIPGMTKERYEAEEAAREVEAEAHAWNRLRDALTAGGAPAAAVDAVLPVLGRVLAVREDHGYGYLSGDFLVSGAYHGGEPVADYSALRINGPWERRA